MAPDDPLARVRRGERWVLRERLADGSATDHVGWVDGLDDAGLQLTSADGSTHRIDRRAVIVARRAPAAAGGPAPRRVTAVAVERFALPGWLARSEPLGEWTLRSGGGFTGRANSAHAVGDPGCSLADAATAVIAYADRHAIAPMAQVITGSDTEDGLRALGWVETYVPTDVLAIRLGDLLGEEPVDAQVGVDDVLTPAWRAAYHRSRPNTADPAVLEMILDGHPPRAFGRVVDPQSHDHRSDALISIGRGHLSGDWLGLASIWTDQDHRRQGWATKIMIALGHWAARQGARYAYLQVASGNTAALTAYQRLGFEHHHSYLYLAPGR